MMVGPTLTVVKGIAGEFASLHQKIIPSGRHCLYAQPAASCLDHGKLSLQIIVFRGNQKCKIQIPEIVENCAAAGKPPGKSASLLFQKGYSALCPGVLVASDDNGVFVLPKIENTFITCYMFQQIFFNCQIPIRICAVSFIDADSFKHIIHPVQWFLLLYP